MKIVNCFSEFVCNSKWPIANVARAMLIVCLIGGVMISGCTDSPSSPEVSDVNSVPWDDFQSIEPPTYEELESAFNTILNLDATLPQDSPRFARALFDEVKNQRSATHSKEVDIQEEIASDILRLTMEEWKVVLWNPYQTYLSIDTPSLARETSSATYPCDGSLPIPFNDGKSDAFRHAYWNAIIAKRVAEKYNLEEGLRYAEELTSAHEQLPNLSGIDLQRKRMDLSNNAAGRKVFAENPQANDEQLRQLIYALPFEFVPMEQEITRNESRLVYFSGLSSYDVSMVGSLTNPDSGGPWDATFHINQCGNNILGGFTIVRGQELQKRRFTGFFNGETLVLNVSDPFVFENPRGLSYCTKMQVKLTGSSDALSGSWTSSNCPLGGMVTLSRIK